MLELLGEILTKRRSTAIVAAVSLVALHEFSKIPVPKVVQNKLAFRAKYCLASLVAKIVISSSSITFEIAHD